MCTVTIDPCRVDLREYNGSDRLHRTHILKLRVFLSFSPPNMGVRSHIESRCISDSDFNAGAIIQLSEYPHALCISREVIPIPIHLLLHLEPNPTVISFSK